jgi:hypothetical protein
MGTVWVVVGSLVAAVFAYVFQILGGRMLGAEAFAPIGVLWTVQFLAMQVLYQPLEHLVNREVSNRRAPGMGRVAAFGAAAGLAAAGILALTRDLYVDHGLYVLFAGLLVSAYALFGYVRGRLAGEGRFRAFAALTAGEATLRLVAALALVWVGGALGLATAMVLAPLLAIAWLRPSGLPSTRGDLARDLRPLVAASIFAQGLLGLAPLAVAALGATAATVSVVFMTFTVYRGPLWVMQGVMARLLPVLVELVRVRDHARLRRWMGGIAASAAASAGLAALAGAVLAPPVLAWLVGADFRPSPRVLGHGRRRGRARGRRRFHEPGPARSGLAPIDHGGVGVRVRRGHRRGLGAPSHTRAARRGSVPPRGGRRRCGALRPLPQEGRRCPSPCACRTARGPLRPWLRSTSSCRPTTRSAPSRRCSNGSSGSTALTATSARSRCGSSTTAVRTAPLSSRPRATAHFP